MDYDVIVIWAGSGGLTASIWLAWVWKKVALIEKGDIWWDCTNFWCVPSKALIDIAKKSLWKIDMKTALEEVRNRRQEIKDEETPEKIEKYWMKVIKWLASFKNKNIVFINWEEITAKNIVISTWSHPSIFNIEWLKDKDILTNETVFEQKENIKDLVVVWWGYIWCELAESFANLWVKVTIIQRNTRLIPREEEEASRVLQNVFEDKWINIICNSVIKEVKWDKIIILDKEWKEKTEIKFDKVLLALWREANIDKLDLDKVWIKYNRWIKVNKYNQTNEKNIFAIWDCVDWNPQFTHLANNQARWVIRNILLPFFKSSVKNSILPSVLYTNIEVARVWKTREELLKVFSKEEIKTEILYFTQNDRSKLTEDQVGFVKINFKALTWKILWATIVWKSAWEMLPILWSAMENRISWYKLSKQIFAYPTKAELIKKVADKFVVGTLSNIKKEILFFLKNNIFQIITAIIWLSLIFSFFLYKSNTWFTISEISINIYNYIKSNPSVWPLIYIVFYTFRPIIFFPGTFMTFMSWALFGFWWGFLYTSIWANLSAILAYFLWWIFWKKLIKDESSSWILIELKSKANESPFISILMTRLLFFPFDAVNYISGLLKINFKWFFLATVLWIIPWSAVFILAWAAFYNTDKELTSLTDALKWIDTTMLLYASILFIFTIILAKVLKKKYK